ncbi:glycoside hydrolase family 5 protein [Nocardiopsis halophila]|uniref:glycoside hydrolase family 5 protein n=1 Tax=Nocardiopsis halophila TaxID=141692 RepID=UPI00034DEF3A|nr:glycoside hydrolase family 5 protein [Nocardiopsis halophila]
MNTKAALFGFTTAALALATAAAGQAPPHQETGLHVRDGRLHEADGSAFVMRGVNHPHVWYPDETGSFADIKALGANTVRVVLGSGQRWGPTPADEVAEVVDTCKENRLICVLEVHDTTGYGEEPAAATLDQAADYWIGVAGALRGQEDHILINLGNEPYGNAPEANAGWAEDTSAAIGRLRGAGLDHALVADAPNWGQDWQRIMLEEAPEVEDPDGNTVFSVHMYGVYEDGADVAAYMDGFAANGLPLIVGEFGHRHSDGDPDEDAILAEAEARGIGYLGWSWSGNSGGVEYLDMVEGFDAQRLTPWGERIFNGENGIAETAEEASVYGR